MATTASSNRPPWTPIPGRHISTGGGAERACATLLDLAERHYLAAADTDRLARWCTAKSFADGLLWAVAVVGQVEPHVAEWMLTTRAGAPSWVLAGPPPGARP